MRYAIFAPGGCGSFPEKMNIERPTSNVEWKKMKELTYDLKERLLEYSVRIIKNDILEETEELIK